MLSGWVPFSERHATVQGVFQFDIPARYCFTATSVYSVTNYLCFRIVSQYIPAATFWQLFWCGAFANGPVFVSNIHQDCTSCFWSRKVLIHYRDVVIFYLSMRVGFGRIELFNCCWSPGTGVSVQCLYLFTVAEDGEKCWVSDI